MSFFSWIGRQWFLIAIVAFLCGGAVWHEELAATAEAIPRNALVAAIMFSMSAPLDLRRSLSGRSAWLAVGVAVVVNAGLAGPAAWLVGKPLNEQLAVGLIVAALAPCTLASAAVWTRRGRGNEAVALIVTVITNIGCFLTLPAWAWLLLGESQEVDALALARRLLLIVVAPIVVGQLIRGISPIGRWCNHHGKELGLAAQLGLLGMVFIGAVRCGALLASPETRLSLGDWVGLVVAAGVVHVGLFAMAWLAARSAGCERADALPAGVAGSQKTLTVGLDVALGFGGLAILPMVVYHALQLLIDAVLVERLGPQPEEPKAATAALESLSDPT